MDSASPSSGGIYRGDVIYIVKGVDKTLATDSAFKGWSIHPDGLSDLHVGDVLARISAHNRRWDAGRVHVDGVHWEERTWAQDELIAFRDHVSSLVEVKLSRREELEQGIANCPIIIRNYQRLQARHARDSEDYADFDGMIAAARRETASLEEKLEALLSSTPEMASAAR